MSVVFPQPDGPIRLTKSPSMTSRLASSSATASPLPTRKTMSTALTLMTGEVTAGATVPPTGAATDGPAPEQATPTRIPDELAVPDGDLPSHGHDARLAVDVEAREGAVVDVHLVRRGAYLPAVAGIVDDEVGVGPHGDGARARVEAEELGGVRRRHLDEALDAQGAAAHAVCVEQVHAVLGRRHAVGDARERLLAHGLLLDVEGRVVGADGVYQPAAQPTPQRPLIVLRAQRRAHHVLGALEVGAFGVRLVEDEVRDDGLDAEVHAPQLGLDGLA